MIVVEAGWSGRTSLGLFMPSTTRCQVFYPLKYLGGGEGCKYAPPHPPVIFWPLQDPLVLLVLTERVDAWLLLPASTSLTGGAASLLQNMSCYSLNLPNLLCKSDLCE